MMGDLPSGVGSGDLPSGMGLRQVPLASPDGGFRARAVDPAVEAPFAETVRAFDHVLKVLGRWSSTGRSVVFGATPGDAIAPEEIVFESEQLARPLWHFPREQVVWTFSDHIAAGLRERGAKRVVVCPLGYVPCMTTIASAVEDVDVVFCGSINDRRREILDRLRAAGLRVECLTGSFGSARDAVIARSKVALNLHFYEPAVFEIFRVAHLLANRRAVVAEAGGADRALEDFASRATSLVPRERVVEECVRFARDTRARNSLALCGFETFRRLDLVENVRRALAETERLQ